jgi:CBS domain-containing protein
VLEGQTIVGIVSERDLRQAVALSDRVKLTVGEVMRDRPYCVPEGTPLVDVIQQMIANKYGSAIVTGAKGRLVGIFTRSDALRILAELLKREPQSTERKSGVEEYLSPSYLI